MKLLLSILTIYLLIFGFKTLNSLNLDELLKSIREKIFYLDGFSMVEIDGDRAYFLTQKSESALIVSLHSWGEDFTQIDPLAKLSKEFRFSYIHPNFQGRNNHFRACCSRDVISSIDRAIEYAIENSNIDRDRVYIVGGSGGGYSGLCHFFKGKFRVREYSIWVPIVSLEDWYYESKRRETHHQFDILKCTSKEGKFDLNSIHSRSPLYMQTPVEKLDESELNIYAGVFDRVVSPMQSIKIYQKISKDINQPNLNVERVLDTFLNFKSERDLKLLDRDILLYLNSSNLSLTLFDGSHEILYRYIIEKFRRDSAI